MGQPPDQPPKKKALSAHQAGLPARHGKTTYDPDAAPTDRPGGLTPRQEEIALLVAEDLTNAEISERTGAAISTVKTHIHSILDKIGGRTRASAIIWLLRRQLAARDREILVLKELLAQGGSSAAPNPQAASPRREKVGRRARRGKATTAAHPPDPTVPFPPEVTTHNRR